MSVSIRDSRCRMCTCWQCTWSWRYGWSDPHQQGLADLHRFKQPYSFETHSSFSVCSSLTCLFSSPLSSGCSCLSCFARSCASVNKKCHWFLIYIRRVSIFFQMRLIFFIRKMFFRQYCTEDCVLFCRRIVVLVSKILNVYCALQFFDGLVVSTLHCSYFFWGISFISGFRWLCFPNELQYMYYVSIFFRYFF